MAMRAVRSSEPKGRFRLSPTDWVVAARNALISGGIGKVKIEPLAEALGVTIGSFYWHFRNRDELLAALIEDWKTTNSSAMREAVRQPEVRAEQRFEAFINVWVEERDYSSAYDSAMRDWARTAPDVRSEVLVIDRQRILWLSEIFADLGYDPDRAEVRARIMYFHQVGYYALDVRENDEKRLKLRPLYIEALRDGPGK